MSCTQRLPVRPNEVAWFEQALSCLRDTGLAEAEKASVIVLVSGYVRNEASTNADISAAIRASGVSGSEWMSGYGRLLAKLADPARFPAITRFIASGVFEAFDPPDKKFIFGLDRILDGIAGLIAGRAAAQPEQAGGQPGQAGRQPGRQPGRRPEQPGADRSRRSNARC